MLQNKQGCYISYARKILKTKSHAFLCACSVEAVRKKQGCQMQSNTLEAMFSSSNLPLKSTMEDSYHIKILAHAV
jgi:hypothetical protein